MQGLSETQADTIRRLRNFYSATLFTNQTEEEIENYQELDEVISKSLITQRKLANDAVREPLGGSFNLKHFKQILASEKELLEERDCVAGLLHSATK